jgi:DNA-directed RNA polymerase specialized sigma24 family protein
MGTDEDFRGFFAQHYGRLCRLGFLLTGDPAQAEELAQDALVLWAATRRLPPRQRATRSAARSEHDTGRAAP